MTRHLHRREVLVGGGGLMVAGLALQPMMAKAAAACADGGCGDVLAAYRLTARDGARDMTPAAFSHRFAPGVVPKGSHAAPRVAVDLPLLGWEVEMDTHPDGSWKTAAYRVELPRLKPGEGFVLELRRRPDQPEPQAVDPLDLSGEAPAAAISAAALTGYAPPDNGAEAAHALKPGAWSENLQRNNFKDASPDPDGPRDYWFLPRSKARSVVSSYSRIFAYGNGVWMPDRQRFVVTGGGHSDWAGSEILAFDLRTLRWVRTEDTCRYCGDETWDGTDLEDWDGPCLDGDSRMAEAFVPADRSAKDGQVPWYPWPNIRGRRAPVSTHTYGYMAYDAARGRLWHYGTSLWPGSGGHNGGLWAINPDSLTWDIDNAIVLPHMRPGYDGKLRPLTDDRVLLHTGTSRRLSLIDLKTGRAEDITEAGGLYQGDSMFVADDPEDPGHKAAYHSLYDMGAGFYKKPRCTLMPDEPGFLHAGEVRFRNPRPAFIDERTCPVVMGDYGRNPRQVVFFSPRRDEHVGGLAVYDTAAQSWAEIPVDLPEVGTRYLYQGFDYIPAYDAFALCTRAPDDPGQSQILLLKRPPQVD